MEKKGISPVIATILLILIAVIIAAIIFVWAKTFVGEQTLKFDKAIELSCKDIVFQAEAFAGEQKLYIVNQGTVPLYGMEISKKGLGSVKNVGKFDKNIDRGETSTIDLTSYGLSTGDQLVVVPIIIGQQGENKKAYTCDPTQSSQTITVEA
jgi:flagellin-like protein